MSKTLRHAGRPEAAIKGLVLLQRRLADGMAAAAEFARTDKARFLEFASIAGEGVVIAAKLSVRLPEATKLACDLASGFLNSTAEVTLEDNEAFHKIISGITSTFNAAAASIEKSGTAEAQVRAFQLRSSSAFVAGEADHAEFSPTLAAAIAPFQVKVMDSAAVLDVCWKAIDVADAWNMPMSKLGDRPDLAVLCLLGTKTAVQAGNSDAASKFAAKTKGCVARVASFGTASSPSGHDAVTAMGHGIACIAAGAAAALTGAMTWAEDRGAVGLNWISDSNSRLANTSDRESVFTLSLLRAIRICLNGAPPSKAIHTTVDGVLKIELEHPLSIPAAALAACQFGATFFGSASVVPRTVHWVKTGLGLVTAHNLGRAAVEPLYHSARSLYNDLTRGNEAGVDELTSVLSAACDCGITAEALGGNRRSTGVLSSLMASLAQLHHKAGRPRDACNASGKSVIMSPMTSLTGDEVLPTKRIAEFVYYGAKLAVATAKSATKVKETRTEDVIDEQIAESSETATYRFLDGNATTLLPFLETMVPRLTHQQEANLLHCQLDACQRSDNPERTLVQQLNLVRTLLSPKYVAAAALNATGQAQLLVQRAKIERCSGNRSAAAGTCQESIELLKGAVSSQTTGRDQSMMMALDIMASAYTLHGLCLLDIGQPCARSLLVAAALFQSVIESDLEVLPIPASEELHTTIVAQNSKHFAVMDTTRENLDVLAGLFGLLGRPTDQLLMYRLIEMLNTRARCSIGEFLTDKALAIANAGRSAIRMGDLEEARQYLDRAENALNGEEIPELSLYYSEYLLACGEVVPSEEKVHAVLEELSTSHSSISGPKIAMATSLSAEIALTKGHPGAAANLAERALNLRLELSSKASELAAVGLEVLQHFRSAKDGDEDCEMTAKKEDCAPKSTDLGSSGSAQGSGGSSTVAHSQWTLIADLFESLLQIGRLYQLQGLPDPAKFYLSRGAKYAQQANLTYSQLTFILALADVACVRKDLTECAHQIALAETILTADTKSDQNATIPPDLRYARCLVLKQKAELAEAESNTVNAVSLYREAESLLQELKNDNSTTASPTTGQVSESWGSPREKDLIARRRPLNQPKKQSKISEVVISPKKCDRIIGASKLSNLHATITIMRMWSEFKIGHPVDEDKIQSIVQLQLPGIVGALVQYYAGLIHRGQAVVTADDSTNLLENESGISTPTTTRGLKQDRVPTQAPNADPLKGANLSKLRVVDLKAELATRGCSTTGRKADLVARLTDAISIDSLNFNTTQSVADNEAASDAIPKSWTACTTNKVTSAPDYFLRAFSLCRDMSNPPLLHAISVALATSMRRSDPCLAAMYLHAGLGIATRQQAIMHAGVMNGKGLGGNDRLGQLTQLYSLRNVVTASDFTEDYIDKLPNGLTVTSISVDGATESLLLSRVNAGTEATTVLRANQGALSVALNELESVIGGSDETIVAAKDILSASHGFEREKRVVEWWEAREALDRRLESLLSEFEDEGLGWTKTLLLGQHTDPELAKSLTRGGNRAKAAIEKITGNHCRAGLCMRILDGMMEGCLTETQVRNICPTCPACSMHRPFFSLLYWSLAYKVQKGGPNKRRPPQDSSCDRRAHTRRY